jgi:hypothetical protein
VQDAYRSAKERQGALDFDDLESRTRRLLNDYPHVRARYRGAEFRHLLVDEFQDTNAAQWDIIRARADLETPGSLFVAADPKQKASTISEARTSVFGGVQGQISGIGRAGCAAGAFVPHTRAAWTTVQCPLRRLLVPNEDSPVRGFEVALGEPMTAERITRRAMRLPSNCS